MLLRGEFKTAEKHTRHIATFDRHSAAYGILSTPPVSVVVRLLIVLFVIEVVASLMQIYSTRFVASECACGDIDMMIGISKSTAHDLPMFSLKIII